MLTRPDSASVQVRHITFITPLHPFCPTIFLNVILDLFSTYVHVLARWVPFRKTLVTHVRALSLTMPGTFFSQSLINDRARLNTQMAIFHIMK